MYADDTKALMNGNELKSLIRWFILNYVYSTHGLKQIKSLDINKTYCIAFHPARIKVDHDTSILMNTSLIRSTTYYKYLGVIINWIPHITSIVYVEFQKE